MGGMEEDEGMDEVTLVRGYAAEEEYEVLLRKKALMAVLA